LGSAGATTIRAAVSGALFLWLSVGVAGQGEPVSIATVIDGDTVILADKRHIRLIGINTPELGRDGKPEQPLAVQARQRLQALLGSGPVRLTPGRQTLDRHGRVLGYLDSGAVDVQDRLLSEGLGWLVAIPPNLDRLPRYLDSQQQAKSQHRGVWGHRAYIPTNIADLNQGNTGFQRISGQVTRIGRSRKYIYLNFNPNFSVRIAHKDWKSYFKSSPESFIKKRVIVSGWVSNMGKQKMGMRIGHPAMIEAITAQ